ALAPGEIGFAELDSPWRGRQTRQQTLWLRPVRQRVIVNRDRRMGEHEGIFRRRYRPRRLMNSGHATGGSRKCRNGLLIRPIMDVDQPEIVILSVRPPALRMVVVLKPMEAENLGDRCEISGCRCRAVRSFLLGRDRHQMTVVAVPGAILACGEEP